MTLTNDQCIQVAEKVWGWEIAHKDSMLIVKNNHWDKVDTVIPMSQINSIVNSWSGFGRTVEGMAEKGLYFDSKNLGDWNPEKPRTLIEATHLAALEAVEPNEKNKI